MSTVVIKVLSRFIETEFFKSLAKKLTRTMVDKERRSKRAQDFERLSEKVKKGVKVWVLEYMKRHEDYVKGGGGGLRTEEKTKKKKSKSRESGGMSGSEKRKSYGSSSQGSSHRHHSKGKEKVSFQSSSLGGDSSRTEELGPS